ncbi:MAG: hypothetical protein INF93_10515 [Rhodobacter sp.]|nr:hypothetical protein [Rhodobacter sp.]
MKLFAFALSLLASLGAAITFGREFDVAYLVRSPELTVFDILAQGTDLPGTPLSNRGMRELFTTCGAVLQGLTYALQPSKTREAVDSACIAMARQALERNPTLSSAHAIIMFASSEPADITRALVLSQMTAPRESWHAKLRLRKGLAFYGTGEAAVDRALESDISFLVQSAGGRAWLAGLYWQDNASRPVIAGVVDSRPDSQKAAFLREVERLGQI